MLFKSAVGFGDTARAIKTAVKWGAKIINMSWSIRCGWYCTVFPGFSGYMDFKLALIYANSWDVLTVAAAGNSGKDLSDEYVVPCQLYLEGRGPLCVGALDQNSRARAGFSNWGWKGTAPGVGGVGIWAPGTNVRVGPHRHASGNHGTNGTSIAAPFVAGAAALAWGVAPNKTAQDIRNLMLSTLRPPLNNEVAPGSIDVLRMVTAAGPPLDDALGSHSGPGSAAQVPDSGFHHLTVLPHEDDYFEYVAPTYLQSARFMATYVEALGDLYLMSNDPTASTQKTPAARTSAFSITSQDLCARETYGFYLRGVNPTVGNAYSMTVQTTPMTSLPPDGNEPNDSIATATEIEAPPETAADFLNLTLDPINCRSGLTLHQTNDVDYYTFTITSTEEYTGVSALIWADFPLTARLYREGALLQEITAQTVAIEPAPAQPGDYLLELRGNTLNAYTMRVRQYSPRGRQRASDLEAWLDGLMPDPGDLLPRCTLGCGDMPPWLQRLPVDPIDLFALQANRITPVTHDLVASDLMLEGSPQFFALGSAAPGMLHLNLDLLPGGTYQAQDQAGGLYASLLDASGNERWRVEAAQGPLEWMMDLEPGQTYLLTVNSPASAQARLAVELPGGNLYLPLIRR